jgi:GntR family transcriptional repressor for pyruvate dehydrogenase complex
VRIASQLRDEILSGRYRAGDRLPSERELAERFAANRGAVREALKQLEQLGIAQIRRGGARAAPIETASLDVVRHLMELDGAPDPQLLDQIFEVFGGLFSLAARLAAERADDPQRVRVAQVLDRLMGEQLPVAEELELIQELSELFVQASQNMVLAMVRRGLHTEFIERIENHSELLRPTEPERIEHLRAVAAAMSNHDGEAAANAIYGLTLAVRRHAIDILEAEQERERGARHGAEARR